MFLRKKKSFLGLKCNERMAKMANMLEKYTDTSSEEFVKSASEPAESLKAKRQRFFKKKELRVLKALEKAVRKHNKLMKQEAARRQAEEEAAEKAAAEKAAKRKNDNDEKGFLSNFAKAICKALPQIVTAVVTGVLGFLLKRKPSGKALQAA